MRADSSQKRCCSSTYAFLSPADETPEAACNARPDEYDLALGIDRVEKAFGVTISRVLGRWAGLRTFSPDELPVIGPDPLEPSFIWCAGQGGYGIQTSPALGLLTACFAEGKAMPASIAPLWPRAPLRSASSR